MRTVISVCLAVAATLALAQQNAPKSADLKDKQKDKQAKEEEQPSLFGNQKIGYKGSKQSKESTTLAYNGIDPSGKVSNSLLAASPTSASTEKAKQMAAKVPKREQLLAFVREGGLNSK